MKHISNDVLTIKDCSCDSVLRINLKEFFPATQTICKQLAKIIDAATELEESCQEQRRKKLWIWMSIGKRCRGFIQLR